jgi:curved DNA-binding protein CbpA
MRQPKTRQPEATPYSVLGLDRRATQAEIKRAYFKLVREFPPEDHPEKFQEIRQAYERLKSTEARAAVDMFLLQPPPEAPEVRKGRYNLAVQMEDMIRVALELKLAELDVTQDFREPQIGNT